MNIRQHLPEGFPKIVCLCGSTRFMNAFFDAGWEYTLKGYIVLSVGVSKHAGPDGHAAEAISAETARRLDELHKRKIDLADEVHVLNVGNYIGDSTRSEIEYAEKRGKPVTYLVEPTIVYQCRNCGYVISEAQYTQMVSNECPECCAGQINFHKTTMRDVEPRNPPTTMITKLCQRENHVDSQGDLFTPECLKAMHNKQVPVLNEFSTTLPPLGVALIQYEEGRGLVASVKCPIRNASKIKHLAIAGKLIKSSGEPGKRVIEEFELLEVGSVEKHADPTIDGV